jgi:hypothetical protein
MKNVAVFISDNDEGEDNALNVLMKDGWILKTSINHKDTSKMHSGVMYILEKEDNSNKTDK